MAIELMTDFELADLQGADLLTPERYTEARARLNRVQAGIDQLPNRCREVIRLRKIEGLSTREVADRMNISIGAVEQQISLGMPALVDFMLGGTGRLSRNRPAATNKRTTK